MGGHPLLKLLPPLLMMKVASLFPFPLKPWHDFQVSCQLPKCMITVHLSTPERVSSFPGVSDHLKKGAKFWLKNVQYCLPT